MQDKVRIAQPFVNGPISKRWLHILSDHYLEPARFYHTTKHIEAMRTLFNQYKESLSDPQSVEFAIFFHDVIYDPKETIHGANEENSIQTFTKYMKEEEQQHDASALSVNSHNVVEMIRCTIKHDLPETYDLALLNDASYFLDFDLSILGSAPDEYQQYAKDIRAEYQHYGDDLYNPGRCKVLESFLSRKRIFFTDVFSKDMEERARANIQNEIDELKNDSKSL